jgi:hypothetical protein
MDKCDLPERGSADQRVDRPSAPGRDRTSPKPLLRRFPPVLQFVTKQRSDVAADLNRLATQGYDRGLSLDDIRSELIAYLSSRGFGAFIRVHEVRSEDMPSYPGQTILTGMLIVDLKQAAPAPESKQPA